MFYIKIISQQLSWKKCNIVQFEENKVYQKKTFCIKDQIKKGGIEVEHFLTESMWSDILNKIKKGEAFHIFIDELMNFPEYYADKVGWNNNHPELLYK